MTVSVAYVNRMKTNLNQTVYHVLSDTAELAPPLSLSQVHHVWRPGNRLPGPVR